MQRPSEVTNYVFPLCGECWTSQLTYLSLFCGEHSLLKRLREYGPPNWLTYVWSCPLCGECWTSQLTYLCLELSPLWRMLDLPTDLLMSGAVPSVENVRPLNWLTYHFSVENTAFWKDLENMALPVAILMSISCVENMARRTAVLIWDTKKSTNKCCWIELKALLHFIKMARLACVIRLCNTSSPSLKTRDWRGFQIRSKKCRYFLNFTVL